jgi:hypothetical protein
MPNKEPNGTRGKGAEFVTTKNPFGPRAVRGGAPSLADNGRLGLALDATIRHGNAVLIGQTRDGGALVITILEGDERHRTYAATQEELDAAVGALEDLYGS